MSEGIFILAAIGIGLFLVLTVVGFICYAIAYWKD